MKLLLTLLGIVLDLCWTIVATIVLGMFCIAAVDFVFTILPRRLSRRFKMLQNWASSFWTRRDTRLWRFA